MLMVVGVVEASPLLSKEGSREAAGWSVQSREATIDAREALLLLIGTVVFEQTAPALAMRGHPRLTKAGNNFANFGQHSLSKEGGRGSARGGVFKVA